MKRTDLSNLLVHWVSGESEEDVLSALHSIIVQEKIYGSSTNIKGSYKGSYNCVCFTETPIEHFNFDTNRYWPFGISVSKRHVFKNGGRPVIYQSESEFYNLPEELRWRHVKYEPNSQPPIDFTWEREWRIHTDEFYLDADEIKIVVINKEAAEEIERQFNEQEWDRYNWECVGYGEDSARYPEPFIYSIKLINED